ncbi:hypothetical protein [Rheinheimera sp.]|uniref:hypothetical protein n=1 Tax=Rheinheimera sp. TaxID=1869214 RepID=UPI003AF7B55C
MTDTNKTISEGAIAALGGRTIGAGLAASTIGTASSVGSAVVVSVTATPAARKFTAKVVVFTCMFIVGIIASLFYYKHWFQEIIAF